MRLLIPNAVTLGGALCALLSMIWAHEQPYAACNALIVAALFDMIDGRVARLLDAQSPLGEQLDSLVDVIAFGVAPAYLLHAVALQPLGNLGVLPMFLFVGCAALRLARFNQAPDDPRVFRGIPSPVAALLLVTAMMTWEEMGWALFGERWFLLALTVAVSLLMVVPLTFPSYKRFKSRIAMLAYFALIGGGLTMLLLGLPGGTVLFGFLGFYVVRGLLTALVPLPSRDAVGAR